jgi:hypothetical protein
MPTRLNPNRNLQEISRNPATYGRWRQVENEIKGRQIGDQVGQAVANAFETSHKFMEGYKQKSPDDKVFAEREKRFKGIVEGAYSDPNQMARFALDNLYYKEEFPKIEKELREVQKELAALRRRIGVTRKFQMPLSSQIICTDPPLNRLRRVPDSRIPNPQIGETSQVGKC